MPQSSASMGTLQVQSGGISGTGWASVTDLGYDASYIFLTPGQLKEL